MNKIRGLLLLIWLLPSAGMGQSPHTDWFADARLGIFIHWGIYAVDGTSESWSFHNRETAYAQCMSQLQRFDAARFNPDVWANLIAESGARYAVLTTQHHDGVALWNTKQRTPSSQKGLWNPQKPLSTVHQSPAARDLVTPFVQAIRSKGIRFGAYYSLLDWSHDDYPGFLKDSTRYKIANDSLRWNRFLQFMHAQVEELSLQFKPDLFWFDGDWEHSENEWQAAKVRALCEKGNPQVLLNGRLKTYGDYDTPEQNMPVTRPASKVWELCMTINNNWGYRLSDTNWKTPDEVIRIYTEVLGMGGNLLLDIGPRADGTIPAEAEQVLKALGRWNRKHAEAVYGTREGLPYGHYHGSSTLSKDSTALYLFIPSVKGGNQEGQVQVMLKGIRNQVVKCEVLGTSEPIQVKTVGKISWSTVPGTLFMDVPLAGMDEHMTVLKLQLDGPLGLYSGKGGFAD